MAVRTILQKINNAFTKLSNIFVFDERRLCEERRAADGALPQSIKSERRNSDDRRTFTTGDYLYYHYRF